MELFGITNHLSEVKRMNLFEIIPEKYFHLLTGSNRQLYAEALLLLFEHVRRERFGVPIGLIRDVFQELIESYSEKGFILNDDISDINDPSGKDAPSEYIHTNTSGIAAQVTLDEWSRSQANTLIRRMSTLKWIDIEVRDRYDQFITLPHYTSRLLLVFQELVDGRVVEYQRFAFATYQILNGEGATERPSFAVREAKELSRQFEHELVNLYNNMKHHMEQVIQKTSLEDVLHHHFHEYQLQIVDKSYHRLKTSDHVSRYKVFILDKIQQWMLDRDWLDKSAEEGVQSEIYTTKEEAKLDIRSSLMEVESTYSGLEELLRQIDLRHNQYLRSSLDRARYLSSQHHQGMDQRLASVLHQISNIIRRLPEDVIGSPEFVRLAGNQILTEGSLFAPRQKRPPHEPQVHEIVVLDGALREELRQANIEKIKKSISRKKVDEFVLSRMGERQSIELKELAPQSIEELIMLSYIYLYGHDGGSAFQIDSKERVIVIVGPFRFYNHSLRKNGQSHNKGDIE